MTGTCTGNLDGCELHEFAERIDDDREVAGQHRVSTLMTACVSRVAASEVTFLLRFRILA